MEVQVSFLDCPEYLNNDGSRRCGLPAEVLTRYALSSTDGPLDGVKISCPRGHWFNGSIESLALPGQPLSTAALADAPASSQPSQRPSVDM